MIEAILSLTDSELEALASAIRAGRIQVPVSALALRRVLSAEHAESVAKALESMIAEGAEPQHIATTLALLAKDRRTQAGVGGAIDLVTTGPEAHGASNRDTSVVVRELFANARVSVLVAGFAVYQGQRVFSALADRMVSCPALGVRMFLDIQRPAGDTSTPAEVAHRFASRFITTQWPARRPVPLIYYYPLSLRLDMARRASLHAKCVVVDGQQTFISSANFTQAAQERNVEVGVLLRSAVVSDQLTRHFDALVSEGLMVSLSLEHCD